MAFLTGKSKNFLEQETRQIVVHMPQDQIVRYIKYSARYNEFITDKNKRNLEKFMNTIDVDGTYEDVDIHSKYYFLYLKELIKVMNDKSVQDIGTLESHFINNFADTVIPRSILIEALEVTNNFIVDEDEFDFNENEVIAMNRYIEDKLKFGFLYKVADGIKDIFQRVELGREQTSILNSEAEKVISGLYRDMKRVRTDNAMEFNNIDFSDPKSAVSVIERQVSILRSPSNKLSTGTRHLNQMINGGFEGGRVYIFFGTPKSFKSGTILNLAMSVSQNNPDVKVPDGRLPVIVYLTMENDIKETLDRMYEFCTGHDISQDDKPASEILETINNETIKKHGIGLVVKYAASKTKDTEYVNDIIDDLKEDNKECIMFVQDYLERIHSSTMPTADIRLELGAVVDEFSNIAKARNIPFITAGQLNRIAIGIRDDMENKRQNDIANNLNISMISESTTIQKNLDYGIIVHRETMFYFDGEIEREKDFIGFKLAASRAKKQKDENNRSVGYFAMPFENGFKIAQDVDAPAELSVSSISRSLLTTEEIKSLDKEAMEAANSTFNFNTTSAMGKNLLNNKKKNKELKRMMNNVDMDPASDID